MIIGQNRNHRNQVQRNQVHRIQIDRTRATNGNATNASGLAVSRFGIYYKGVNWNSYLSFIRGNSATSGSIAFVTSQQEALRINSSGNVGIDTTDPQAKLDVRSTADTPSLTFNGSGQAIVGDSATQLAIGRYSSSPFSLYLQGRASNNVARNIALSPAGGNVGIGTTNPTELLVLEASSQPSIVLSDTTTASTNTIIRHSNGTLRIDSKFNNGSGVIAFTRNGTVSESARFDTSGRFGIGTTTPAAVLHVTGTVATTTVLESSASQSLVNFRNSSTSLFFVGTTNNNWNVQTNAQQRLSVTTTGNVGVGTSSPGAVFTVGTNAPIIELNDEDGATDNKRWQFFADPARLQIRAVTDAGSGGGNLFVFNRSNQQVQSFQGFNGGAAWFHVDNSTKRVGIGTTSPSETLTISGTTQDVARIKTSAVNAKLYFEASATTSNNYIQCTGNELLAVVNGGERLRINSSGNVGIGSNAPVEKLDIANGILRVSNNATPSNENDNAAYFGKIDGNAIVSHSTAVAFRVNSTERVRIDSSGNLLVNISSARTNYRFNATSISPLFQLESNGGSTAFGITRNGNTGNAGSIYLAKSRGTTSGSNTIVQQDDRLGSLSFNGADGTDLVTAARIEGQVDGTPGTNDMPGRLVFLTTADGASNPTERLRIDSDGKVGIGTSDPQGQLTVQQSAVTNAPSRISALYLENNANCEIQMVGNPVNDCQVRFGTGSNSFKGALEYQLDVDALLAYTNGSERLRITSSGNVGIGTSSPARKLEIQTGSGAIAGFKPSTSTLATTLEFLRNGVGTITNNAIEVKASNGTFASINYGGGAYFATNVGIGTTNPGAKLDVQGTLFVRNSSALISFNNETEFMGFI